MTIRREWIAVLLCFFGVSLSAKQLPEWRGYCQLPETSLFSLTEASTGKALWVKIGDTCFGYLLQSGSASSLILVDKESGDRHELRLVGASAKVAEASLPPLSKADAISWIRAQMRESANRGFRKIKPEEMSETEKKKIAEAIRSEKARTLDTANVLVLNARSSQPESIADIMEVINGQNGDIPLSKEMKNGVTHATGFRKLTLDSLPTYVRTNLSQGDLDSLLPEQAEMMKKAFESLKVEK